MAVRSQRESLLRAREGPTRTEVLTVGGALLVVAVLVYGYYVLHGGFYGDDWSVAGEERLRGLWTSVSLEHAAAGGRTVSSFVPPFSFWVFGMHPALHLAAAGALWVLTSLCLFVVLRLLAMAPVHAAAIAGLSLLFPWSDSVRLWNDGATVCALSVCLFLLGLILGLRSLRHRGRAAVAMHSGTVVLYILSVLSYEATAAVALLAGVAYIGRTARRAAIRLWLIDAVAVLVALGYDYAATVNTKGIGTLAQRLGDVRRFARESAQLLSASVFPVGSLSSWAVRGPVLVLVAVIIVMVVTRLRGRKNSASLAYWLRVAVFAALAIGAAYFMFLGSYHYPADPGGGNRTNVVAGLAYCTIAYAIIAMAATLAFRGRWPAAVTVVAAVAISAGYIVRVLQDEQTWRHATRLQHVLLSAIDRHVPHLQARTMLLTFGFAAETARDVSIFDESWDLNGAVELSRHDVSLRAYPVWRGVRVGCEAGDVRVSAPGSYGTFTGRYGRVAFFDEPTAAYRRIQTLGQCTQALQTFRPGPYFAAGV